MTPDEFRHTTHIIWPEQPGPDVLDRAWEALGDLDYDDTQATLATHIPGTAWPALRSIREAIRKRTSARTHAAGIRHDLAAKKHAS